jgi:CDP-paratose 2-epimerase
VSFHQCIITGGCGFVGSSLALRLKARQPGCRIVALDNFYRAGSRLNVSRLRQAGIEVVEGDVRRKADLEALGGADLVIDAAAEPSVMAGAGGTGADYVVDTNLVGTLHLLECARRWKSRFLFLSTSRVYPVEALRAIRLTEGAERFEIDPVQALPGVSERGIGAAFPLEGPRTLYGSTKLASEIMVREYAAQFGLDAVVNRCGVIAGPWQMGKADQGVVALWVARHLYGLPLRYIGYGGKQVRDVLHVDDLADLVVLQAERRDPFRGEVYMVGGGRGCSASLRELTALCREATGRAQEVGLEPAVREGDVPLYVTDGAATEVALGWKPARSMQTVVGDIAAWIEGNKDALRPVLAG